MQIQSGWLIPVKVLTSALDSVGFSSTCIAISNTEDDIDDSGVNAVWAIASALGEDNGIFQITEGRPRSLRVGVLCRGTVFIFA